MGLAIGDRVVKNPETWVTSTWDTTGRGVGVGLVTELMPIAIEPVAEILWPCGIQGWERQFWLLEVPSSETHSQGGNYEEEWTDYQEAVAIGERACMLAVATERVAGQFIPAGCVKMRCKTAVELPPGTPLYYDVEDNTVKAWPKSPVDWSKEAVETRAAQDGKRPGGWISVNDALPEKDGRVIVYCPDVPPGEHHVFAAFYYVAHGWSHRITHWMPLPKPPGEKP